MFSDNNRFCNKNIRFGKEVWGAKYNLPVNCLGTSWNNRSHGISGDLAVLPNITVPRVRGVEDFRFHIAERARITFCRNINNFRNINNLYLTCVNYVDERRYFARHK